MSGTVTLLQLGGYVGLLLWGTHMAAPASSAVSVPSCASGSAALCRAPGDALVFLPFLPASQ